MSGVRGSAASLMKKHYHDMKSTRFMHETIRWYITNLTEKKKFKEDCHWEIS